MSRPDHSLRHLISNRAREAIEQAKESRTLKVAVLGSSLENTDDPDTRKRLQIYKALQEDGHSPFFPENCINEDPLVIPILQQETTLLEDPAVDLVLILHTDNSIGVANEIVRFSEEPEILAKSAVLFPEKYYKPSTNITANEAYRYFQKMAYSKAQFDECWLVLECLMCANARATGLWRGFDFNRR